MSSNDLIALMQRYGVKAELLGALDEPSPEGLALGDMLADIHRLEADLARVTAQRDRLRRYVYWLENMGPTTLTVDHRKPFLHKGDLRYLAGHAGRRLAR